MINIDEIISEVSRRTGVDKQTVNIICKHVFKFTEEVMKDPNDYHDILFNNLLRFSLKGRFKEDKTKSYSPKL